VDGKLPDMNRIHMRARRFLIFRSADTSSWWRQQRRLGFRRDAHLFRHIPLRETKLVIFQKKATKRTHIKRQSLSQIHHFHGLPQSVLLNAF